MLINGHTLYVESHGLENDPPVVLLHDGLGSVKSWRDQISVLTTAGFRVVAYDRWGYGKSDERPGLDVPTFVTDQQDLIALLEQLRIERIALVGHSDGGTIALYCASRYPDLVCCLVTVAAHIYIEPKMEGSMLAFRRKFEQDANLREALHRTHGDNYCSVFNNWFGGWYNPEYKAWDMRPLIRKITCPTWVVQGEGDEYASPQHAADIAQAVHQSELWLANGAGHMLPQENANEFNPRLVKFLQAHAKPVS